MVCFLDFRDADAGSPGNEGKVFLYRLWLMVIFVQNNSMKKNLTFLCLIILCANAIAQKGLQNKLELTTSIGFQVHDKRFFSGNDEGSGLGTHTTGFGLRTNLITSERFMLKLGAGILTEVNTYQKGFEHCFPTPGAACDQKLRYINKYHVLSSNLPINLDFPLSPQFSFVLDISPQFSFYKTVLATDGNRYSKAKLEFYTIECIPGILFRRKWLAVSLGVRAAQFKAIDPVYLYGNNFLMDNPGYLDRAGDFKNQFKIQLGVFYLLNNDLGK